MTPIFFFFFCIFGTSNPLSDCSKNFKKIYRVENFRANVLKEELLFKTIIYLLFFGLSIGDEIKYNVVPRASTDETGLVTDEEDFLIN